MTEQEEPSGDSRLKEILGFDPVSGERIGDEQIPGQIGDPNLKVPEDVKKEFIAWKSLLDRLKIGRI